MCVNSFNLNFEMIIKQVFIITPHHMEKTSVYTPNHAIQEIIEGRNQCNNNGKVKSEKYMVYTTSSSTPFKTNNWV